MRVVPTMLAVALAAAISAPAPAQSRQAEPEGVALKAFVDICVAAAGDADRALEIADGLGWAVTRWDVVVGTTPSPRLRGRQIAAGGAWLRLEVDSLDEDYVLEGCSLFAAPLGDGPPLDPEPVAALAAWIDMEAVPELSDASFTGYAFTVAPDGARHSLHDQSTEALETIARAGAMHVIMAGRSGPRQARLSYARVVAAP